MYDDEHIQALLLSTDAQHRELGALFESARSALASAERIGPAQLDVLVQLVSATEAHFRTEEEIMRLIPDGQIRFGWHFEQHRVLLYELIKLREDAARAEVASVLRLLDYLGRWMTEHMNTSDPSLERIGASARDLDRDLLNASASGPYLGDWLDHER